MKKVLTIAGSDPCGGAGLQKDLAVFTELGAYGLSVVTAVTSQNTRGVQDALVLDADTVASQIKSVFDDVKPDAVKTGMLGSKENVEAVYKLLKKENVGCLIVDPVMVSSSGFRLLDEDAIPPLRKLCAVATLSTPNIAEAYALSGVRIASMEDRRKVAGKIGDCVITGGDADAKDILYYNGGFYEFPGVKKNIKVHGTGCMFSSAIAVYLAYGLDVPEAVRKAKDYVTDKITESICLGGGFNVAAHAKSKTEEKMVRELESAIRKFVSDENAVKAAPEVGINIVYALPDAKAVNDVYGLTGRIVKAGGRLVPVGEVKRGGSSHVARVILTAMKHDPEKRAAINIKYSEEAVEACYAIGLTTSYFDRAEQPLDTPTMEWGTEEAIRKRGRVPDVIYDKGSVGKEAMMRIIGKTPDEVVGKALKTLRL